MVDHHRELLIAILARRIAGLRLVVVGAISPIPAAAALLVEAQSQGATRVIILGSQTHFPLTDGGREVFDLAGSGRVDAFFLSGGQIDGAGNINLVGVGDYPDTRVRFPGSFGSGYLYYVVPRVILFREEHSRRVLVPRVDFISAPGSGPAGGYRPGGPEALVTGKAVMTFDQEAGAFSLESLHPGVTLDEVIDSTGFAFAYPNTVPETLAVSDAERALIRGPVRETLAKTYPAFVATALS